MINRKFWWGVGSAGLAWLFKRQIRGLAVAGTKGVLLVGHRVQNIFQAGKEGVSDIIMEAGKNNLKEKIDTANLAKEELAAFNNKVTKMSQELKMMQEVMAEHETKEKKH
ncbi:MAG: hypothetical protein ACOYVD_17635 [Bacillota bacterium]